MKTERMTEVAEMRSNMAAAILKTLGSDYYSTDRLKVLPDMVRSYMELLHVESSLESKQQQGAVKNNTDKKITELEARIAEHGAQIVNQGIEIQNVRSHTMFNDSLTSSRIKGIENRSDTALFIGVAAMIMSIVIGCAVLAA